MNETIEKACQGECPECGSTGQAIVKMNLIEETFGDGVKLVQEINYIIGCKSCGKFYTEEYEVDYYQSVLERDEATGAAKSIPPGSYNHDVIVRLITVAENMGWNGVDNSKLLDVFLKEKFDELKKSYQTALDEICRLGTLVAEQGAEAASRKQVIAGLEEEADNLQTRLSDQVGDLQYQKAEIEHLRQRKSTEFDYEIQDWAASIGWKRNINLCGFLMEKFDELTKGIGVVNDAGAKLRKDNEHLRAELRDAQKSNEHLRNGNNSNYNEHRKIIVELQEEIERLKLQLRNAGINKPECFAEPGLGDVVDKLGAFAFDELDWGHNIPLDRFIVGHIIGLRATIKTLSDDLQSMSNQRTIMRGALNNAEDKIKQLKDFERQCDMRNKEMMRLHSVADKLRAENNLLEAAGTEDAGWHDNDDENEQPKPKALGNTIFNRDSKAQGWAREHGWKSNELTLTEFVLDRDSKAQAEIARSKQTEIQLREALVELDDDGKRMAMENYDLKESLAKAKSQPDKK